MTSNGQPTSQPAVEPLVSPQMARMLRYLLRRWWIPVLTGLVGIGLGVVYALNRQPSYTAAARMWVGGTLRIPEGAVFTEELENLFGTQTELMKSEKIRQRAHDRVAPNHATVIADPPEVEVLQPRKTSLFQLQVTGPDPDYLRDYLDAVMQEYLNYRREVKAASSEEASASLMVETARQERELREAEAALMAFQQTNNAVVLEEEGVNTGNYLSRLELELAQLKLEYSLLDAIEEGGLPPVTPTLGATPATGVDLGMSEAAWPGGARDVQSARQQMAMLKVQRDELAKVLKAKHPKMIELEEEIARGDRLMEVLSAQTSEQIEVTRRNLGRRIASIEETVRATEVKVLDLNRRTTEFDRLKRAIDRAQGLYDRFRELVHSVDVNKRLDQVTVSVLDQAMMLPTSSGLKMGGALGGFLGGLMGLGLVGWLAQRDDRLRSPAELPQAFPFPILGQIPEVKSRKGEALAPVEPDDQRSGFVESFRALRSTLLFMAHPESRPKTILITSAEPGEGKSTVALNLARILAFAGSKVLLIDGDLRHGTLHERLGTELVPGLANLIAGQVTEAAAVQSNGLPNLAFLPAGGSSSGSGELFLHRRFDQLILEAAKSHDFILIDSAPVLTTADTSTLAPRVDAVLVVIRPGDTRSSALTRALDQLAARQANVVGCLVNGGSKGFEGSLHYPDRGLSPSRRTAPGEEPGRNSPSNPTRSE